MGPDADCLIGPNFKPFYDHDKGKDLGVISWPPDQFNAWLDNQRRPAPQPTTAEQQRG